MTLQLKSQGIYVLTKSSKIDVINTNFICKAVETTEIEKVSSKNSGCNINDGDNELKKPQCPKE